MTYHYHGYCRIQRATYGPDVKLTDEEHDNLNAALTALAVSLAWMEPPKGKVWLAVGQGVTCSEYSCDAYAKVFLANDKRTFSADSPWSEFVYDGEGEHLFDVKARATAKSANLYIYEQKVWFSPEPYENALERIKPWLPQAVAT
jgi:hypothetical protein